MGPRESPVPEPVVSFSADDLGGAAVLSSAAPLDELGLSELERRTAEIDDVIARVRRGDLVLAASPSGQHAPQILPRPQDVVRLYLGYF